MTAPNSDISPEAWNELVGAQTRQILARHSPNSERVLNPSHAQLPPGGSHPTDYLIKRADELGRGLSLDKEPFEDLIDGCHDEFNDEEFAVLLKIDPTKLNAMVPFWACFTARHLRSLIEGAMNSPDPVSNYMSALCDNTESLYFYEWEGKNPEGMRLLTESHAKKMALLSATDIPNMVRASAMFNTLITHRPAKTTAASRLTPPTLKALMELLTRCVNCCTGPAGIPIFFNDAESRRMYDLSVGIALEQLRNTKPDGRELGTVPGGKSCDRNFCVNSMFAPGNKTGVKCMRCGKCKAVYYCSPACQKLEYRAHKRLCFENEVSEIKISEEADKAT